MRKHKMRKVTTSVINWMNCIWLTDLPPNAKYLACYLRKFMNDNQDMAWPSYARIIEETGLSRATVAKYLKLLDSEGWITRERESGENTTYVATLPKPIADGVKELDSSLAKLVQETNYPSLADELPLVQQLNTNKQVNKQVINNNILSGSANRDACSVIEHMNKVCGTRYRASTKSHIQNINARLGEGFTVDDLKKVVDAKQREWGNDPKMAQYLRPQTLFSAGKFQGYLTAANSTGGQGVNAVGTDFSAPEGWTEWQA